MRRKWGTQWDGDVMNYLLKEGPNSMLEASLAKARGKKLLIIGAGGETNLIKNFTNDLLALNISRRELLPLKLLHVDRVIADADNLPLAKSTIDFIVCKSTLHHLANFYDSINEFKFVLKQESFMLLYEPGLLNFISFLGRRFFPTQIHDVNEKPLNLLMLKKHLQREFEICSEGYFFIFIHAFAIIAKHLRIFRDVGLIKWLNQIDSLLCKTFMRYCCWIVVFLVKH